MRDALVLTLTDAFDATSNNRKNPGVPTAQSILPDQVSVYKGAYTGISRGRTKSGSPTLSRPSRP